MFILGQNLAPAVKCIRAGSLLTFSFLHSLSQPVPRKCLCTYAVRAWVLRNPPSYILHFYCCKPTLCESQSFLFSVYSRYMRDAHLLSRLSYRAKESPAESTKFLSHFLITYGICKKRSIVVAWLEKKNLLLMNVYVLYVLDSKQAKEIFRLSVCTKGRLQNLSECTITFEGVSASKQNFMGVFYV